MKTSILLFLLGILTIPMNKTVSGIEASTEFGVQEHPCPPFNQESYDYLVDFASNSGFPHSYEGIMAQAIPPEEIQWLEFHPKCENIRNVDDGYVISIFKSNQYFFEVALFTEHITIIDDEYFTFRLEPSSIVVYDKEWVIIGIFYI
jgi:hypothetical protein